MSRASIPRFGSYRRILYVRGFSGRPTRNFFTIDLRFAGESLSISGRVVSSGGWPKSGIQVVLWAEALVAGNQARCWGVPALSRNRLSCCGDA